MRAQFEAMIAAVHTAATGCRRRSFTALAGLAVAAAVSGCQQTVPLAGPDPADPGAKVQSTAYRSTVAPYRAMRPAAPAAWSARDRSGMPATTERSQP